MKKIALKPTSIKSLVSFVATTARNLWNNVVNHTTTVRNLWNNVVNHATTATNAVVNWYYGLPAKLTFLRQSLQIGILNLSTLALLGTTVAAVIFIIDPDKLMSVMGYEYEYFGITEELYKVRELITLFVYDMKVAPIATVTTLLATIKQLVIANPVAATAVLFAISILHYMYRIATWWFIVVVKSLFVRSGCHAFLRDNSDTLVKKISTTINKTLSFAWKLILMVVVIYTIIHI